MKLSHLAPPCNLEPVPLSPPPCVACPECGADDAFLYGPDLICPACAEYTLRDDDRWGDIDLSHLDAPDFHPDDAFGTEG